MMRSTRREGSVFVVMAVVIMILAGMALGYFYLVETNPLRKLEKAQIKLNHALAEISVSIQDATAKLKDLKVKYSSKEDVYEYFKQGYIKSFVPSMTTASPIVINGEYFDTIEDALNKMQELQTDADMSKEFLIQEKNYVNELNDQYMKEKGELFKVRMLVNKLRIAKSNPKMLSDTIRNAEVLIKEVNGIVDKAPLKEHSPQYVQAHLRIDPKYLPKPSSNKGSKD